jgi:hypothetical protein
MRAHPIRPQAVLRVITKLPAMRDRSCRQILDDAIGKILTSRRLMPIRKSIRFRRRHPSIALTPPALDADRTLNGAHDAGKSK